MRVNRQPEKQCKRTDAIKGQFLKWCEKYAHRDFRHLIQGFENVAMTCVLMPLIPRVGLQGC